MPIRKDLRHFYLGPEWRETRARILKLYSDRCAHCGKPDHTWIFTYTWRVRLQWSGKWEHHMVWRQRAVIGQLASDGWRTESGGECSLWGMKGLPRSVFVILTVAHLDHDPANNADENLRALCPWCHLHFDQGFHKQTRSSRKDEGRVLLSA